MATISVSEATKARLSKLRMAPKTKRDSYEEVVDFLLDHFDAHEAWPFTRADYASVMGARRGESRYRPEMDMNSDGVINSGDQLLAARAGVPAGEEPAPPPPPPPPVIETLPFHHIMVVPKDYPLAAWAFGDTSITWERAYSEWLDWMPRLRAFMEREAGLTFRFVPHLLYSGLTAVEMGNPPPPTRMISPFTLHSEERWSTYEDATILEMTRMTASGSALDGCGYAPIPEGQGGFETTMWEYVIARELQLASEVAGKNYRRWDVLGINWGGWAGGRHAAGEIDKSPIHVSDDAGMCIIGDWQHRYWVTGTPDTCCDIKYGGTTGSCASRGSAWSHEMLHLMNVSCHKGDVLPDGFVLPDMSAPLGEDAPHEPGYNHLYPGQIMQLVKYNVPRWMKPIA